MTPNDRLLQEMYGLSTLELQNRLMALPDREIALSLMYMKDGDRHYLLTVLSAEKQKRIREELVLHARLRIHYNQYRLALDHVVDALKGTGKGNLRSYLKPVRYKT
ncbi:MAG: hypothetical protein E4H36_01340 [Spirochaetales bacterium]|nr:MAG: hypothetical protein E4H36_01340 [Spirochaetales bacterium]